MSATITCDVLVIGARCAGAGVAMLLARRGLRVLAVDRAAYGEDTMSTHALMRGAVLQLHRWRVLPAIVAAGTPPVRRTSFQYGDEIIDIDIRPSDGVDALYAPRRTVLDATLVDAARAAGAEIRHGVSLAELERDRDGRIVGAVLQGAHARRIRVRAGMVIGADGIASTVARQAGAQTLRTAAHACGVVFGYFPNPGLAGYRWCYGPGASAGFIATNDDRICVFAAMRPERLRAHGRGGVAQAFRTVIAETSPDLAPALAATEPDRYRVFSGVKGFLRQAWGPGWALVGDAGYFRDPITAHGITDALRDAELLAGAVARGGDAALAEYEAMRDALALPLFAVTDRIASFDWDLETVRLHHQALNAAMKRETAFLAGLPATPIRTPGTNLKEKAA
jgi:2-polyprenyl-6-methoxyphenol hydroxylase-like FAD-dependent oxidoreductase